MDSYEKNRLAHSLYFCGRAVELEMLRQGLAHVIRHAGKSFYIAGDAGMGKSRLLHEFVTEAKQRHPDLLALEYSFLPPGIAHPSLFQSLFNQCRHLVGTFGGKETGLDVIAEKIGLMHELSREALNELAGKEKKSDSWESLDPNTRKTLSASALWDFLSYLSGINPLVLIIEDAHWADIEFRYFIQNLARNLSGRRILFLLSARKTLLSDYAAAENSSIRLELQSLSREEQKDLLDQWLGKSDTLEAVKSEIMKASGGNPLFLNEIVSVLADRKFLTGAAGKFTYIEKNADLLIPTTMRSLIEMRLNPLTERQKYHIRCASVIGQRFSRDMLLRLTGDEAALMDETLAYLMRSKIIYREAGTPVEEYQFYHALIHEAVYNTLPGEMRMDLHARLLRVLRTGREFRDRVGLCAHHAFKAGLHREAFVYNFIAGNRAANNADGPKAAACYRIAIDSLKNLPANLENNMRYLIRAHMGLALALSMQGRHYEARVFLKMAEEDLGVMPDRPASIGNRLKSFRLFDMWIQGNLVKGIGMGRDFIKNLSLGDDPYNFITATIRLAGMLQDHGRYGDSNEVMGRLDDFFNPENASSRYGVLFPPSAICHSMMSRNYGELGEFDMAEKYAARCLALLAHNKNMLSRIYGLSYSSTWLIRAGRAEGALAMLAEACEGCRDLKNELLYPFAAAHYGFALFKTGRIQDGFSLMENACAVSQKQAAYGRKSLYIQLLAEARFLIGDYGQARQLCSKAIATGKKYSEDANVSRSYYVLGLSCLHSGTSDYAGYFRTAETMALSLNMQPLLMECREAMALTEAA